MALLMPEDEHANLEELSEALSKYYNCPGRSAIFRRKLTNVGRRYGEDPAAFTTELEILGLASRISNACSSTDPGRGWIGRLYQHEQHCWSLSEQFYPPLRHQQATQKPEPLERAGRRPRQPARQRHSDCFGEGIGTVAVRAWHVPDSVKQVRQFVGFIGYYRRFIQNFAGLSEPLVALTRKRVAFAWTTEVEFDTLRVCLHQAPTLGFLRRAGLSWIRTPASLQWGRPQPAPRGSGGCDRQCQPVRWYCTTLRELLAAVSMCTHFRSYLRGAQLIIRSGGSRSSGTVMTCWLVGICCSARFVVQY